MAHDWNSFTKSITIKTTAEKLYHAFATKAGMESWFLRKCDYKNEKGQPLLAEDFVKANNPYSWYWFGYNNEVNENGQIFQANGTDLFEFSFNANGKNDMKVKVTFTPDEGESRVNLHQYNIPDDDESKASFYAGCGEGWTFYLANLKSILEGGLDLRNKNEAIKKVVNS